MIVRGWYRRALSSSISLVSLAVGLLLSSVLLLFVINEYNISKALTSERCYVLEQTDKYVAGGNAKTKNIHQHSATQIAQRYPEIEQLSCFRTYAVTLNDVKFDYYQPMVMEVNNNVADLFDFPIEEGNLKGTLSKPDEIALTRSFASTLVTGDPLGQTVKATYSQYDRNTNGMVDVVKFYNITTILKDPVNQPLRYKGLVLGDPKSFENQSQNGTNSALVKLAKGVDDRLFMKKMWADTLSKDVKNYLVPLDEVYFTQNSNNFYAYRSKTTLFTGFTITLTILLISIFNYINLTLTRAPQKLKNLSGQRIMGASKWCVRWQTVADTTFNVILAVIVAAIFVSPALQIFNSFMNSSLEVADYLTWDVLRWMIGLLLTVVALPSLYIIVKLEIGKPLETFKNPNMRKAQVARNMVIAQFVISVVLLVVGINVARQIDFITKPIPNTESMININFGMVDKDKKQAFVDRVLGQASTIGYTLSSLQSASKQTDDSGRVTHFNTIDSSFFNFYGVKLVEGRNVDSLETNVVVNQTFVKYNNMKEPVVGSVLPNDRNVTIVGVCEDFISESAKQAISPSVYRPQNAWYKANYLNFAYRSSGDVKIQLEFLEKLREEIFEPGDRILFQTVQEYYKDQNQEANRMKMMIMFFMLISLFLTCVGMFGMSWYTVQGRCNEIALRKIHGATTLQMVKMLCRSFFFWVAIGTVVAIPIAHYLTGRWLEQFAYRVDNSVWVTFVTVVIMVTVTFVTVIWQTYRAANANSAQTMKKF